MSHEHAVIELRLADEAANVLRSVWEAMAQAGLDRQLLDAGARPHVSLVVGDSPDFDAVAAQLDKVLAGSKPFQLNFSYYGFFRSDPLVGYLGVTQTLELAALQERVYREVASDFASVREHFTPAQSVFHSTLCLAVGKEQLSTYWEVLGRFELPRFVDVTGVDLMGYFPGKVFHSIRF